MPLLEVFELKFCFISERTARFIASHIKTLKRVRLEDCYSAASDYNAEDHTTWANFFDIIADSLDAVESAPLEAFFVTPRVLERTRKRGGYDESCVVVKGDDAQIELAFSMAKTDRHRRPFDHARLDDKYGFLSNEEEQNLNAYLLGHDQAAYDRVMAFTGRQSGRKQRSM